MMSDDGISSSIGGFIQDPTLNPNPNSSNSNQAKRKRNLPGTPDPDAEVIALSPKSLMATNRFICEICNKGFQRDQNLQLHRRGHNLPWKLKQRNNKEVIRKKVYICPEKTCVHHDPSRALGDLTGIKKHYSRKHGEKKWKCEKCSKKYAVQSDWKAHSKICGTREYKCDCGTLFSRKDSFITHRAFCDALAEESARFTSVPSANVSFRNELLSNIQSAGSSQFSGVFRPELTGLEHGNQLNLDLQKPRLPVWLENANSHLNSVGNPTGSNAFLGSSSTSLPELVQMASQNQWFGRGQEVPFTGGNSSSSALNRVLKEEEENKGNLTENISSLYYNNTHNQPETNLPAPMSATALLQKAAQMGSTRSSSAIFGTGFGLMSSSFSSLGNFNSFNQSRNEVQNLEKAENLNGLMASSCASTMSTNRGGGFFRGDIPTTPIMGSSRNSDPAMMMPNITGNQNQSTGTEATNSLTRDFLGVEGSEHRQFLQQNELSKFALTGSAMDSSHYSKNH
ncbi:indeterminate-domain 9-like [Olea europaea subsp. europaea]|uniref:Indeterminate-domain 9-like n=2 Tax=Olea europaea subsp. europaea TaxID=158383 RepID=A0A8S0QXM8_OLEEU|nr:indeterminate-domain 9-like [Olea europaea subsp. europaea]